MVEIGEEDLGINHEREAKKRLRQRRVRGKQVTLKHLNTFCRFLLSLILIVGSYYFLKLPGWYLNPEVFTHPDGEVVRILNNKIVPTEKIYTMLSGVAVEGNPIFVHNPETLRGILLELPPVEDVYVRRYAFPARIDLIFKERIPVMTISPDIETPPVAYFTQDGTLVGKEYAPYILQYHTLLVLSYGNKGDDYHKWDKNRIDEFLKFTKFTESYSKENVEYIDCRNPEDVYVKISSIKIRLGKLDNSAFDRVKKLSSILPEIKLMDENIKYLDLRWKDPYLKLE